MLALPALNFARPFLSLTAMKVQQHIVEVLPDTGLTCFMQSLKHHPRDKQKSRRR
jgi:hypothetical protein